MMGLFQTLLESFLIKDFLGIYYGLEVAGTRGVTLKLGRDENCLEPPGRTPEQASGRTAGSPGDTDWVSLPCLWGAE